MDQSGSLLDLIRALKKRVLNGGEINLEEGLQLIEVTAREESAEFQALLAAAQEITFHFNSEEPGLCSLINAKSNMCGEDCGFCAQSVRFDTRVDRYQLMSVEEVVAAAKAFEKKGARNFCIVTSGGELNDAEFEKVIEMYGRLKAETGMNLDGSLGWMTPERVQRLKAAGVRRFNDNLQSSREFYPKIVSTHTYDRRLETLRVLQEGDMEICSGGILGMGETREDRVRLALELKPFAPHCLPMNILNPRPGTPLESQPVPDPLEMIKTIAVFRFIHPRANIKLAGGREINLGSKYQEMSLRGGANGLIIGGYLTTQGNPMAEDFAMLKRAGFKPHAGKKQAETGRAEPLRALDPIS
ncbi:MAG: biotin synthase BioB [Omnitrophica bacterium GWA2_52_8]|nr:MAG: biotin synthase BioB [Omnitrophica bacterium GWA2_52_8]